MTRNDDSRGRAGFTLIETMVALTVLLAFAMVFEPLMFQARHIFTQGRGEIRAQVVLRSLLAAPFARDNPETGLRDGESGGLRWSLDVEPYRESTSASPADDSRKQEASWALFKVDARVTWGAGRTVAAETLRLGRIK